jgi:putative adenylate-forming enzyme
MNLLIMLQLLHHLQQMREHEHWDRRQLRAHQENRLRELRAYAYAHSPFYQRFHRGLMDRPLEELPVLTKQMMMEHFDELVTDRAIRLHAVQAHVQGLQGDARFLGRYWVNATSGSSGYPGLFLFDQADWVMVLASFARAREWAGVRVNLLQRMKMASIASTTPWHMSERAGATLRSVWLPTLRLAASDPLPQIVARLNAWQPEMLVAYASVARILAEEQRAGRLRIQPRLIFTSSEVLTAEARRRVEAVWGPVVFNEYAATETGSLAAECRQHHGLHLFEDLVITEVVDEQNQPVPPGTYGAKVLITALYNRTQPLIRYELHDSVRVFTETCPCGRRFTLLDGIQGRTEDTLTFPARFGGVVALHPLVFHRILDAVPAGSWQIVQGADHLTVLLAGAPADYREEELAKALQAALTAQGVVVPAITVERVAAIPKSASGKAPLIKAYAPPPLASPILVAAE